MESAIDILKQQYEWILANEDLNPHSDDYYEGYKEATKHCLDLIKQARRIVVAKEGK